MTVTSLVRNLSIKKKDADAKFVDWTLNKVTYNITPLFSTIYSQDTNFKFFEKRKEFVNSLRYVDHGRVFCMLSKDSIFLSTKILNRIRIECENHLKVYTKKFYV